MYLDTLAMYTVCCRALSSRDLLHRAPRQLLMTRHHRVPLGVEHRLVVACQVADRPVMEAQQAQTDVLQEVARVRWWEGAPLLGRVGLAMELGF